MKYVVINTDPKRRPLQQFASYDTAELIATNDHRSADEHRTNSDSVVCIAPSIPAKPKPANLVNRPVETGSARRRHIHPQGRPTPEGHLRTVRGSYSGFGDVVAFDSKDFRGNAELGRHGRMELVWAGTVLLTTPQRAIPRSAEPTPTSYVTGSPMVPQRSAPERSSQAVVRRALS